MVIDKNAIPTKLLWVDLEMTGLDASKHVILEVAAEVTDFNFKKIASYKAVIYHRQEVLNESHEWAAAQHKASGLTDRVINEGQPEKVVVRDFATFIKKQFGDEPAVLAGNSIYNDRIFIKKWWPEVDELLHYRMLDVSSLKILMQGKYGVKFEKADVHRAYDDIQASIAELENYLEWFKNHN